MCAKCSRDEKKRAYRHSDDEHAEKGVERHVVEREARWDERDSRARRVVVEHYREGRGGVRSVRSPFVRRGLRIGLARGVEKIAATNILARAVDRCLYMRVVRSNERVNARAFLTLDRATR